MGIKIEKERRWLLKNFNKEVKNLIELRDIHQFYGEDSKGNFRVRKQTKQSGESETKYYLTRKKRISKDSCIENEIEITFKRYLNFKNKSTKAISKKRWVYKLRNKLFAEIDIFQGISLIIVEVEFEGKKKIIFPEFIQRNIIKEITGEEEFSNFNLAQ